MLYIALLVVCLLTLDEIRSRRQGRTSLVHRTLRHPPALGAGALVVAAITIVNLVIGASPWSMTVAALAGILVSVLVSSRAKASSEIRKAGSTSQ